MVLNHILQYMSLNDSVSDILFKVLFFLFFIKKHLYKKACVKIAFFV